ncbi:MAG: 50S ribosomal protein L22 [Clostridia bacterium]|nr:50S ribosomal protein L22 [Clostridia bacterium]
MAKRMKEKALARKENADRRPQATAKYVRISPSKVKIVLDIIRGKDYNEAMAILQGTPKAASEILVKILASAGANAENNLNMSKSDLYVAECYANSGPTYKRWWPRSHGSADTILKRTSHITIILDERANPVVARPVKKAEVSTSVDVNAEAKEEVKAEAAASKSVEGGEK